MSNRSVGTEFKKSRFSLPISHCYELLIPLMTLSWSWTYDFPMALSTPLRDEIGITDKNIQLLYSAYFAST